LRSNLYNSFERIDPSLHRALFAEIDRPSLSVRTYNLIRNELDHMKIYNYDLLSYTPAELLRIPNLGRTALYEVQNHLRKFGLELGTPLDQIKDKVMSSFIEHVSDTLAHIWKDQ
jgi:DNA-directed RNA polymerase alpha subunit